MSFILNIDTSGDTGSVSLTKNGKLITVTGNGNNRDHAGWLHNSIKDLIEKAGIGLADLNAIAVSNGPGSYTGLRISLSTAKGLCYALQIPLIAISTLQIMAAAAMQQDQFKLIKENVWLCPMIDARRMEAYFAIYNTELSEITAPQSAILNEFTFMPWIKHNPIVFFGNGSYKLQSILSKNYGQFLNFTCNVLAEFMCPLSYRSFIMKKFENTALSEPLYIKEFFTIGRKDS